MHAACKYILRARTEPSPAKTKMKVDMSSDKVALMESGWVTSSGRPKANLRGGMAPSTYVLTNLSP